jgi:hypothetical protein
METIDPDKMGRVMSYPDIQTVLLKLPDYKTLKPAEMPSSVDVKVMCEELKQDGKVVEDQEG